MSQEKGNSHLEMGKSFHRQGNHGEMAYAATIATTLREELGSSRRMIKTVMRWSGASERTVKLWLAGQVGPSARHLVALVRNSEDVFQAFLLLSQRRSDFSTSDRTRKRLLIIARLTQEMLDDRRPYATL
jgi:hypothetical protein